LLVSCDKKQTNPALWNIGSHKKKFKKIFDHYSKPEDSLKLRAAKFLVQNMENHFYYQANNEDELDQFFKNFEQQVLIDDPCSPRVKTTLRQELIEIEINKAFNNGKITKAKYRKRFDIKTLSPAFLIENIEYAFKAWEFPWARNYTFEEFCTYILPYRYGNETPGPWRKQIYEEFKWIADSLKNPDNSLEVATYLNHQFFRKLNISKKLDDLGIKLKISNQKDASIYANCFEQAGFGVCMLRSLGIPATIVNVPRWAHLSNGHELTGMLDSEKKWHYFNFGERGPDINLMYNPPKMFFKRFDKMENFRPILEDASDKLMKVVDFEVSVQNVKADHEVYLCVFGNLSWHPLFMSENKEGKVIFKNIGKGRSLYMAAVKSNGKLKAVSSIFKSDTLGNLSYLTPNHEKVRSVSLSRKFPKTNYKSRLKSIIGGDFSVSEKRNFSDKKSIFRIDSLIKYDHNIIECETRKGKYFRYDFPKTKNVRIDGPAEVSFYTTINQTLKKIKGKYFGSPQLSEGHIKRMTDDDPLTYVEVWRCLNNSKKETGKIVVNKKDQPIWIGLEVNEPITVTHIGICPRNDKNGIYSGMQYELFYWNGSWKSLGKKIASKDSIMYDGVPENSVLWLRNLEEGKEERIFTMENGDQKWW
jgi:hypothetical protein